MFQIVVVKREGSLERKNKLCGAAHELKRKAEQRWLFVDRTYKHTFSGQHVECSLCTNNNNNRSKKIRTMTTNKNQDASTFGTVKNKTTKQIRNFWEKTQTGKIACTPKCLAACAHSWWEQECLLCVRRCYCCCCCYCCSVVCGVRRLLSRSLSFLKLNNSGCGVSPQSSSSPSFSWPPTRFSPQISPVLSAPHSHLLFLLPSLALGPTHHWFFSLVLHSFTYMWFVFPE